MANMRNGQQSFTSRVEGVVLAADRPLTCTQVGRLVGCPGSKASRALTALVDTGRLF